MSQQQPSQPRARHRHVASEPGESEPFHFESTWRVPAATGAVWDVLSEMERWPQWWQGMSAARLVRPGDAHGQGKTVAFTVGSPLGYGLDFTVGVGRVRVPDAAVLSVTGDLRGVGLWSALDTGEDTRAHIMWCVTSPR